ncbi:transposase [Streptomyces sp. NPDC101165]|uniref:transposase n=1 Tax=Streptomyces sp. NPDC101165 TaxID=3366119 RepID=UPI0037F11F72
MALPHPLAAAAQAAGIPEKLGFATKSALATEMIGHALDADVPAAWVTGDEVYGGDPHLSAELERRQIGYVLAVSRKRAIPTRRATSGLVHRPTVYRRGPGSSCQREPAPKATASTTVPRATSTAGPPVRATGDCSPDGTDAPVNSPSVAATRPTWSRCPRWSRWPDAAGPWKRPSRPPRCIDLKRCSHG